MAKHRHTPGPWTTFNGTDVFPDDGDTRGDHQIADAMPRGSFLDVGEMMANAQLIAAAPDMLEALERIESNIGWRGKPDDDLDSDFFCCEFCGGQATDSTDVPHHDECLVHVIRTALARAKGGK